MNPRWTRFAWYWDRLYGDRTRPGELDFYGGLARSGGRLVEPACGSGRLIVPLAAAKITVWGADSSPTMVALARQRLDRAGLDGELMRQDLAAFDSPPAAVIALPLDAFRLLLTVRAQRLFLARAGARLAPGGVLALDLTLPHADLPPEQVEPALADAASVVSAVTRWRVQPRCTIEETWFTVAHGDGRTERVRCREAYRNVGAAELEARLSEAGLTTVERWADFDGRPCSPDSPRLVLTARRAAGGAR